MEDKNIKSGKKPRGNAVLIIDNDDMNLEVCKTLLQKKLHCRILTADNGVQGMEIMRSRHVQLVITELVMPYFNGFQVLQTMRQEDGLKDVPVMIFTREIKEETIMRAAQFGIVGYVKKPFTPDELIERVKKHVTLDETHTILVVDDDERILEKAENIITNHFPHDVLTVTSGIEALELLRNEEIQMVLSGTDMPLIDGLRLLTFVREDKRLKNLPVVFMDYEADPDFIEEADELGFQGFVDKPLKAQALIAALENALE